MDPRDIAALIEQNLPGSKAHVQTDGQGHYEATVVAAAFAGKRSLQRLFSQYVGARCWFVAETSYAPNQKSAAPVAKIAAAAIAARRASLFI